MSVVTTVQVRAEAACKTRRDSLLSEAEKVNEALAAVTALVELSDVFPGYFHHLFVGTCNWPEIQFSVKNMSEIKEVLRYTSMRPDMRRSEGKAEMSHYSNTLSYIFRHTEEGCDDHNLVTLRFCLTEDGQCHFEKIGEKKKTITVPSYGIVCGDGEVTEAPTVEEEPSNDNET